MYSCEKDDSNIIDPVLYFPVIDTAGVTPDLLDTSFISVTLKAKVTSTDPIASVIAKIVSPQDSSIAEVNLVFDGTYYSAIYTKQLDCFLIGNYKVEFLATTSKGLNSNLVTSNFGVINPNNIPPVVSNIVVTPDSTQSGVDAFLIFMISATDFNGNCDIMKVLYTGTTPNGTNLTPRNLFDDGSCCPIEGTGVPSGDTTAYDNKYTRKLFGGPPQIGYYKYYIKAVDRTGDTSNVLSDSIYVYP